MGRQNRRRADEAPRPLRSDLQQVEEHDDGDWHVRRVSGASATKTYRCPGCDHEVRPGTPHVVAWPAGTASGEEHRRHWHTPCWEARSRRGPGRGRAPRY